MISVLICILISLFTFTNIYADTTYTIQDVKGHNTESNCWVIFEDSVYDITKYVKIHDRYMNIRDWCGGDITEAFKTKDNTLSDHKQSSYSLLETFRIGVLDTSIDELTYEDSLVINNVNTTVELENKDNKYSTNYNIIVPLFSVILLYWIPYFIIKDRKDGNLLKKFNGFWNTLLILFLLIPSFGFGIFMILRYTNNNLWNVNFDFLFWHVELSLVMGVIAVSHFIQRLKMYIVEIKK